MTNLTEIIHDLKSSKGLSDDLIEIVISDSLKAAYKKRFGTDDNAEVVLDFDNNEVSLYSKKVIVENVNDDVFQISLNEAKELEPECELGDLLLIEFNPEKFSRTEIRVASQLAHQRIREFEGNSLYSEFKNKEGEIVIGYYLRESNNNIIVDLGRAEGILPKRNQSSREIYQSGDRIKALVYEVAKKGNRFDVLLSRTHPEFIKKIFELEVPEIYDGTVEIVKIVREPGYRTKIAVRSLQSEIDPVGTCVGTKGIRINNVMLELDNERIDVLKYDSDPLTFIHNSLSPAEVRQVIITDYAKRTALAIVDDDKLSIAIGKLGLNVRLANRITDWSINIKTSAQFQEMEGSDELAQVFENVETSNVDEIVDITKINEWEDLDKNIADKLIAGNIEYIEDLLQKSNDDFKALGLDDTEIVTVRSQLQNFDIEDLTKAKDEDVSGIEEDVDDEELLVEMLPFDPAVLEKIKASNILSLYDLVELYSNNTLDTITDITEADIEHIQNTIKENIELEE